MSEGSSCKTSNGGEVPSEGMRMDSNGSEADRGGESNRLSQITPDSCSENNTLAENGSGDLLSADHASSSQLTTDPDHIDSESRPRSNGSSERQNQQREVNDEDSARFFRRRFSINTRQYRRRSGRDGSDASGDELFSRGTRDSSSSETYFPIEDFQLSSSSSDTSTSTHSMDEPRSSIDDEPTPKALLKPKPMHKWFAVREMVTREMGYGARWQGSERFQHRYYGSLHAVQRLELMYKLEKHKGCVNSLHFNRSGELLVSASDDKRVVLWNWAADKPILSYDSGHTGNVFEAKFLPLSGDRHIVTCARDGQVRLSVLSGVGVCKCTRLLAQHRRPPHKLATHHDTPHVFLSAGEDALVMSHDVRTNKASRMLIVKENATKVGLYSIHSNPVYSNEFIVTGEDQYIRLYDRRKISEGVPLKKFCPSHLLKPCVFLHVTCAVFNYNGTEVIGSYNDDDIYLFDTRLPSEADYVHKYEGHRNSITVKGVNFFGPRSEFIVSGSDCGNIFFWDKNTEAIVQWMRGDEEGVVNCLEPHPRVPIIATSGLDSDIKIWVPSCEQEPLFIGLKPTVMSNQCDRDSSRGRRSDPFDNRQMRWLWRQIQRFEQRRRFNPADSSTPREEDGDSPQASQRSRSEGEAGTVESSPSSEEEAEFPQPQCSPS